MKVRRIYSPRPPAASHVLERRLFGHSSYTRSVTRRRLKQIVKARK